MKKFPNINVWGAIASLVVVFFFFACDPTVEPNGPDPEDPTPTALVEPVVTIGSAENVTDETAILVGWVKPNEKDTKVYFEYKISTESSFHQMPVSGSYTDTISMKITLDLFDLTPNAEYSFKITAVNAAGKKSSKESKFSTYVVRDYDGNYYQVIKIGTQTWLKSDLKATHYADGTVIPNVTDGDAWAGLSTGAYCWYNNDAELGKIFGALYNWYAATRKTFITGYHLPSADEFTILQTYLGGADQAKAKMMSNGGEWKGLKFTPTNSSGFTSLPAGERWVHNGNSGFEYIQENNLLFTSSTGTYNSIFMVNYGLAGIQYNSWGASIRLIKD